MSTRRFFLSLTVLLVTLIINGQTIAGPNGEQNRDRILFGGTAHEPRLIDVQPEGWYYRDTRMLTVEFPATGFVPYTLSVSSDYATVDYFVTTPLTSVYISPDVVHVDLQLETDGGDIFYGSFEATSGTLSQ